MVHILHDLQGRLLPTHLLFDLIPCLHKAVYVFPDDSGKQVSLDLGEVLLLNGFEVKLGQLGWQIVILLGLLRVVLEEEDSKLFSLPLTAQVPLLPLLQSLT